MEYSGGNRGYCIRRRPREYPRLPQQKKLKDALESCGIVKGIGKKELQEKMVSCIPLYFKEHKDG